MYNVLLVDDEYYHREALKSTICWEEYGCCICGEANNGVLGIERAKELKPDIVLADVSMPFLNGLQMIEEIKQFLPNAVFAIVTGYSEFEYAKRGMELGVKYLIVKPVSHKELIDSLGQMVKELDTKKRPVRNTTAFASGQVKTPEIINESFWKCCWMATGISQENDFYTNATICSCHFKTGAM